MSFDTNAISGPKDLATLCEAFKVSAVDAEPEVQAVVPPIVNVGVTQQSVDDGIYAKSELSDQMNGVEAYLQNAGNTSIIGECFAQGMKMGQDTVGDFSNTWSHKIQPQQIIASIDNGPEMDVTQTAQAWTPDYTMKMNGMV